MVKYLRAENDKFSKLINNESNQHKLYNEFTRSIESFHKGLATNNAINQIDNLIKNSTIKRNYITFNYTSTLELLLNVYNNYEKNIETQPIHIHGKLDDDIVLGIDNIEQIQNTTFSLTRKGCRAFIKTFFNEQYDNHRVETAKRAISESNIICTYGFSMGESDQTWNNALLDWLSKDTNHHLVVYQYDKSRYSLYNRDEIMDVEDEKKLQLLQKLHINNETLLDQIHIPIGSNIFNFTFEHNEQPIRTMGSMKFNYQNT